MKYIKINKKKALTILKNNIGEIVICKNKTDPDSIYFTCRIDSNRIKYLQESNLEQDFDIVFETLISEFNYYNRDSELGNRTCYYLNTL